MNGIHQHTAHDELATERTALLANSSSTQSHTPPLLPPVAPIVQRLEAEEIGRCTSTDWCPYSFSTRGASTAFSLLVLLELRARYLNQRDDSSMDVWGIWLKEKRHAVALQEVDRHILAVWSQFLEEDSSPEEVEEVLWHPFPTDDTDSRVLRVVDIIGHHAAPQELLAHRLVFLSLLQTWKRGRSDTNSVVARSLWRGLDRMCTPRVMHMMDLLLRLAYLGTLAHIALLPVVKFPESLRLPSPGSREVFVLVTAVANIARPWSLSTIPFVLTVLAFLSCLPTVPFPDDLAYSIILVSLSWQILELHLSIDPSPVFLFPFKHILPLTILIWHGISRIFLPVATFFLPALLLSLFLLSTSLSDMFPQFPVQEGFSPAPMETRIAFLSLFAVMFLLLLCSLVMLVLVYPPLSSINNTLASPWDRYSNSIGLEARKAFIRTVVVYSTPRTFPPPFNLLQLIAIRGPMILLSTFGLKGAAIRLEVVEGLMWRATVAPIGFVVAGFWVWGFSGF